MNMHRALAALALGGGFLVAILGTSRPAAPRLDIGADAQEIARGADHVSAVRLAEWIRGRRPGLRVIDLRPDSEYEAFHVPTASHVAITGLAGLNPAPDQTIVLYSGTSAEAAQAWVMVRALGATHAYYLRGGAEAWAEDIMSPALPEPSGNKALDSTAAHVGELSRYFGGVPHTGPADFTGDGQDKPVVLKRMRRRGC